MYDVEAEHRDARSSFAKKLAALVAMVLLFGILGVLAALDIDILHMSWRREAFLVVAAVLVGAAIWSVLERRLYRPRFPFVVDLPPTDRP
jgi:hypothetical protein